LVQISETINFVVIRVEQVLIDAATFFAGLCRLSSIDIKVKELATSFAGSRQRQTQSNTTKLM
jgi:hypothetical protein